MKKGPIITGIVAIAAMACVIGTFASSSSPYVTVAQARTTGGDHLHLAGDIQKDTVRMDVADHSLHFQLKDQEGSLVEVIHRGEPPANLSEANRIVAIGGMKGGSFESHQLLVKCPSKYEGQDKTAAVAQK